MRAWVAKGFKAAGRKVPDAVKAGGLEYVANKGWRFVGKVAII